MDQARLLEAELNDGYESVISFADWCRYLTDEQLKDAALQLVSQAEAMLAAVKESLAAQPHRT
jgi:hypothetical protein